VTMEYQNVQASVNFSHLLKGPGMLPCLCNRPILFVSSRGTPCIYTQMQKEKQNVMQRLKIWTKDSKSKIIVISEQFFNTILWKHFVMGGGEFGWLYGVVGSGCQYLLMTNLIISYSGKKRLNNIEYQIFPNRMVSLFKMLKGQEALLLLLLLSICIKFMYIYCVFLAVRFLILYKSILS
jgi:hypothetical protein